MSHPVQVRWFDPTSGALKSMEDSPVPNQGRRNFTPPGKNAAGNTDWVLVLEGVAASADR
jgi:hypothetical protein